MEVGRLARDPCNEFRNHRIGAEPVRIKPDTRKLAVAELCMERAVADRMDRNCCAAASAFGHGMVPFRFGPERAFAEPARVCHG